MEVDARYQKMHLGRFIVGSSSHEIQSGIVARSYFEGMFNADPRAAGEWLAGAEAAELFALIDEGYVYDKMWSGDSVATWSQSAWDAGRELYMRVADLLAASIPEPPPNEANKG